MHYATFEEAKTKWNERRRRMSKEAVNYGFMLTNWGGGFHNIRKV